MRDFQNSGLAHVVGTGLTLAEALEEFRREKSRTAFYDARGWGVTEPASQGGGRANAIVTVPGDLLGPAQSLPAPVPCFYK